MAYENTVIHQKLYFWLRILKMKIQGEGTFTLKSRSERKPEYSGNPPTWQRIGKWASDTKDGNCICTGVWLQSLVVIGVSLEWMCRLVPDELPPFCLSCRLQCPCWQWHHVSPLPLCLLSPAWSSSSFLFLLLVLSFLLFFCLFFLVLILFFLLLSLSPPPCSFILALPLFLFILSLSPPCSFLLALALFLIILSLCSPCSFLLALPLPLLSSLDPLPAPPPFSFSSLFSPSCSSSCFFVLFLLFLVLPLTPSFPWSSSSSLSFCSWFPPPLLLPSPSLFLLVLFLIIFCLLLSSSSP